MTNFSLHGDYERLGLEVDAKREEVEKTYKDLNDSYVAGQISFEDWFSIELAYTNITSHLDGLDEVKAQEKMLEKKAFLIETERMRRITNMVREEEKRKGPFWTRQEDTHIAAIQENNSDFFEYMANGIEQVLAPEFVVTYKNFLAGLKTMWEEMYLGICQYEYDLLVRENYDLPCNFSVGMDELALPRFPKGKYRDVFNRGQVLSQLIPGSEMHYVINRHLALLSEIAGLGFQVTYYDDCPIYTFSPTTRLKKYKEEYLEQFGEEVRGGKRKSPYVDSNELKSYVAKSLKPYNSCVK